MFFSIVLRKPVWNLYDCIFAHVTSMHAVNVSACLLWMDFTVCSMIHNSHHQLHERHEQQLPNSWNLYISVHAFQLHTTLCSLACTVDVYRRVAHMNDFQTCKPNCTMTSEQDVSFLKTVTWHVNVVITPFIYTSLHEQSSYNILTFNYWLQHI